MARSGVSTAPTMPFRIVLWLFGLVTVIPLGLLLLTSIKSKTEVLKGAFALPAYPHFENYVSAWTDGRFGTYFVNSVIVVVPVVGVSIVLGLITGFAFAYLSFPLKKSIFVILTIGMMVPTEAFIIPLYYEMLYLDLINTYWVLILTQIALSIPFATIFMASAMRQLPAEVLEAAVLDGATRPQVLMRVIVPLLAPAVSTLALFLFIWTWNEFLLPLILVNDDALRTLPIGALFFQGKYTINTPVLTAGAVIVIAPLVLVYLIFQRKFIEGMTSGATK
ncbi:MAG TPA: carbohydrate ABC transporter permease [Devosia sp.]|jgi:raffinose/stachyose/melibiose transport system permease protein|nr:carbohydrate ABC transporter permease [Devosia sp.]